MTCTLVLLDSAVHVVTKCEANKPLNTDKHMYNTQKNYINLPSCLFATFELYSPIIFQQVKKKMT